jgi:hypothetical protein
MTRFRLLLVVPLLLAQAAPQSSVTAPRFAVTFPSEKSSSPLDGRLLVMLSTDSTAEPRFRIVDGPETQLVFGLDVDGWAAGRPMAVDARAFGYPLRSLEALPAGRYWVQALLNRYETFTRNDGHMVKLPPDKGEGQQWNRKPGNLYSTPRWVTIGAASSTPVSLVLDREIPAVAVPANTRYVKHERIQSRRAANNLIRRGWQRSDLPAGTVIVVEGYQARNDTPTANIRGILLEDGRRLFSGNADELRE